MKKCDYCAKEISYHEMYCCDECRDKAYDFYDTREKFQKLFSVINGIFVLGIGICIFLYSFMPDVGLIGGGSCMTILGVMYLFLPFPPDVFIEKQKLKKAIFMTRIIAGVILAIGAAVLIYGIIRIL